MRAFLSVSFYKSCKMSVEVIDIETLALICDDPTKKKKSADHFNCMRNSKTRVTVIALSQSAFAWPGLPMKSEEGRVGERRGAALDRTCNLLT